MYSTSYLHEGASKTWYGVSSRDAELFERAFSEAFTGTVANDPELFVKKAAMVPPWQLLEAGVPVSHAVQRPGEFIVTLPQAYHAGFSHGFNTAEAVNFMMDDWLPYAQAAATRYRLLGKEPVVDLDSILVHASQVDHSPSVHSALCNRVVDELNWRKTLRTTVCSLVAEDHPSSAFGQIGLDSPFASPLVEATMTIDESQFALGRSPPCATCGRICHFGFVCFLRGSDAHVYVQKRRGSDTEAQCKELGHHGTVEGADGADSDDWAQTDSTVGARGVDSMHANGVQEADVGARGKRRSRKNIYSTAQASPVWASRACVHILCMEHAVLKVQQMVSERGEEMAGGKAVVGKKKRSSARGEEEEAENEAADADGNFDDAAMMLHMRYDDTCMCEMATVAASKASEVKKGLAAGVDDGKRAAAALTQHHISHHPTLKPPVATPALPEAVSRALNGGSDSAVRRGGKKKRGRSW